MLNFAPLTKRLRWSFHRFTIPMPDGRSFAFPHRNFIALGRGVISVIAKRDVSHTIHASHIVSVEEATQANGS